MDKSTGNKIQRDGALGSLSIRAMKPRSRVRFVGADKLVHLIGKAGVRLRGSFSRSRPYRKGHHRSEPTRLVYAPWLYSPTGPRLRSIGRVLSS